MDIAKLLELVKQDAVARDAAFQPKYNKLDQTLHVTMEDDDGAFEYHVPDVIFFEGQIEIEAGSDEPSSNVDAFWAVLNDHYQM